MIISIYDFGLCYGQIIIKDDLLLSVSIKEEDFKSLEYIKKINEESTPKEKELLENTIKQIKDYLKGNRKSFDLNLSFECSDFSKRVYKELLKTEYGKLYKYKDIAKLANSPKAFRAVGTCMKKNPFAFIVPCHRVVKSEENIGNYFIGGNVKEYLISMENKNK